VAEGTPQSDRSAGYSTDTASSRTGEPLSAPAASSSASDQGSPAPDASPEERVHLGLSRTDRLFLLTLVPLILLLILFHLWQRSQSGHETIEIERLQPADYAFRIEINRATWVEWMQLEGIGEIMGKRIVQDREERGPFTSIDDVQRVSGIGPKTMAAIRPHLDCADCPPAQ
jgi:competence protein ComEA